MRTLRLTAWAIFLCASIAGAQPAGRKEPVHYAGTERASRVEVRPPGIRLGLRKPREFALTPLGASELATLAQPGPRMRLGVHRSLPANILSNGAWESTSDGTRVWRMGIHSPGSTGIRVEFRNFSVGSGRVWLHDGASVAGPYSGRGIFEDGHFWTGTVSSDSVTVEYEPSADAAAEIEPPFEIRTISHQARPTRAATKAGLNAGTTDPADYCHLDPSCYPDWKSAMSMVGQLTFEEEDGEYLCSGSLVATRDNSLKPYLLTAGHCINSEAAARTLEVYWTYQTSSCGGPPPVNRDSSTKSSVGAHLVDFGTIEHGDYSLVLLKDFPNNVTFSGWDPSDPPVSTDLVGLHHPVGSWKRISFGQRVSDETVVVEDKTAPGNEYLQVLWDKGRTEPGSSGSPLFSSPGVIVGTLTYGPYSPQLSTCEIQPSVDGYGRFSNTYQYLKDYLENLPAAAVTSDKSSVQFAIANHVASAEQSIRLTTQSPGQITYKLRADASWINLSNSTGKVSANAPGQVTITVDPTKFDRPDQYSSTVTILSGTAPPQYIDVTATVSQQQSNVLASIAPSPVILSGGLWSFKIRLAETGGAATRITAMKVNGADYSSSIAGWFGTDHIDAKGAVEAPLQAPSTFPRGTQYFEFSGIDDASGQHWYRVATVNLQ